MALRLAIIISHPIQHFSPWHREVAKLPDLELKVFFCCDWGIQTYFDREFQSEFRWDLPLLEGYEYEFLPIRKRPIRLSYLQVNNPSVASALERFNPDVIKVFGYSYRTNWYVANWADRRRKPLLLYSDSNGGITTSRMKRVAKRAVVSRFYRKVDGALFVGDNNREYHRAYGMPPDRLFVGCLPIDLARLSGSVPDADAVRKAIREKHGIPDNAFVIMFCGKYSSRKRPLDLVMAANAAFSRGIPVWALLVGEGSQRQTIERFCHDNNVSNIRLTGFVNQSKIPEYYAASDVLSLPSSFDPHPLVVTEGSAFGLPTIVSDRVGCVGENDTARPGFNAMIYPCGDKERLSQIIETMYSDHALYEKMSNAAVQVSASQDVKVAAIQLRNAAQNLHEMGPRE